MPERSLSADSGRLGWVLGAVVLGVVIACHSASVGFGFLDWDDPEHVTRNAAVLDPARLLRGGSLLTPELGYPIPLTVASYAAEAALLGVVPWHFHLINVLLHAVSCLLCFVLARRMGLSLSAALLAALVLGLHPVVAEPVSWVTGRKDLLACVLGLGSLALAWPGPGPKLTPVRRLASLVCYALALLAKPAIAPLALLIPLAERQFAAPTEARTLRSDVTQIGRSALPYVVLLLPVLALGVLGQSARGAIDGDTRDGASFARATWYALGHHLRLLLGLEEPTAKYLPSPWPPGFVPAIDLIPLLVVLVAGLIWSRVSPALRRPAGFAIAWATLTYLPSSNLIPLARYLADSYVYLPLIGLAWLTGVVADALVLSLARMSQRAATSLRIALPLVLVLLALPPLRASQARFRDDLALWQHALTRYPQSDRVCRQWANASAKLQGAAHGLAATDACIAHFGPSLFVRNRALLLARLGRPDEARDTD